MSSELGNKVKINIFGQSHGQSIGVVIDGLPAGEFIDMDELELFMARRRPGGNLLSTPRHEADIPKFLAGIENGRTCGSSICAVIENSDTRSSDYAATADMPRPGHADYTAFVKWRGCADMRGGGKFSGRLTAPMCIAGGIAKQLLSRRGVYVGAHLLQAGKVRDVSFPLFPTNKLFLNIARKELPVIDDDAGILMRQEIGNARANADSVGGVIECAAIGVPAGLGDAMFSGVESRLSAAVFGIPAVKGVEFGAGFKASEMMGSENNDPFEIGENGSIVTSTNNCGGILGGITTGMPIILRAAFKPTPSIGKPQKTVSLSKYENAELSIIGRHDPCVAHRAVPVVEGVTALVLLDLILEEKQWN